MVYVRSGSGAVEFKGQGGDDRSAVIGGYALKWDDVFVYNEWWSDRTVHERFAASAFDGAIGSVHYLLEHEGMSLASTDAGHLFVTRDETGLATRAELDTGNPRSQELLSGVRRGDVNGQSVGVSGVTYDTKEIADGVFERTVTAVEKLWEVSAVTWPAYKDTSVSEERRRKVARAPSPLYDAVRHMAVARYESATRNSNRRKMP